MKKLNLTCLILAITGTLLFGGEGHKAIKGPKGGKVLEIEPLHVEFFVNAEHKVEISFYDESMKPVAATEQVISATAEPKTGKAKLEFEKKGEGFISKTALPEGDGYTVVLQIKPKADAKPTNFRITYHDEVCKECKMAEYACVCEAHGGGGHEGHAH